MNGDSLTDKVNALPEDLKEEVSKFIDSLIEEQKARTKKAPKAGFGKDIVSYISPDFDEPLE